MNKTSPQISAPDKRSTASPFLIINADDLGINSSINEAIADSFSKGLINSCSLLVNMEGFEHAITIAGSQGFKDKIGIHINLSEGRPLTDLSNTSLTDAEGRFIRQSIHRPSIIFSSRLKKKIKEEIKQQYLRALENGIRPTHINSHHHVHTLPWISGLFLDFAKKENVKIRIAETKKGKNLFKNLYRKYLNSRLKRNRVNYSDRFENAVFFLGYLDKVKDANLVYEVMVHPAYQEDVIIDNFSKRSLEDLVKPISGFFTKNVRTTLLAALNSTLLIS